ncbi:MAG: formylglycine-generating enzyme family protein [Elusimicrobia bacterium]|nr:formylglycine-generating enzyme family protein [Elusimicrobiota bacterium]
MRFLPTLLVGAMVAGISGLALWRAKTLAERTVGVMSLPVERLAADWDAQKVPQGRRVVTFLLSDARAAADPFMVAPEPRGGLVETAGGWVNRNLIGAPPVVQTPTELGRAFDSTTLVRWTHDGYSAFSEDAMSRELEKAIVKAHDAGAEINIVAQGEDAAPALMALKRLEGVERGGVKVGANKVMLLGMNAPRLKRIPSVSAYDFSRPGNVLELANIWVPREEMARTMRMQVFGEKRKGGEFALDQVWPGLAEGSDSIERSLRLLRQMVESPDSLERAISRQEQALLDAEATRKAAEERKYAIVWVPIPGGSFMMGDEEWNNSKPAHRVKVKSFEMSKTEVTNRQYRKCVEAGACTPAHGSDGTCQVYDGSDWKQGDLPASFQGDDQPVVCVDWSQAKAFARWAGGRLPSEAEWEYAARGAGKGRKYPWGNEAPSCRHAVMDDGGMGCGRNSTWPGCSKTAGNTEQGLCDMAGNVWEWTQDWFHDSYNGAPADGSAWEFPAGSRRVARGGSWSNVDAGNIRAARRSNDDPGNRSDNLGLHVAR